MKVLFVFPNITDFHQDYYSFGLASIISITRSRGHVAKLVVIRKREDYLNLLNKVDAFRPRVVGFSSVSSQFSFVKRMAQLVKERFPDIITICGGVHPTINARCILESSFLDGIFVGESEYSFAELLDKIENNQPYKDTDNFAYVKNGEVIINNLKPLIANLDRLPYPDREVYPFADIIKEAGFAPFFFSRGCPYLCSYCSNHAIAGVYGLAANNPRYRSPESCIGEIKEAVAKFDIDSISIGDDIFGVNKKWRDEFCEKYKKRVGIKFSCVLHANIVDEELMRLLKDTGCWSVSIGIESGNEYIRNKVMNRHMSNEQIMEAFHLGRKYKLKTISLNIIGTPGETESMIWDTIKLNRKTNPVSSGINIFYPYKGTKLGDYCFRNRLVNEGLYRDFSNERRDTVLNYPDAYKERLRYYRDNWDRLVYPFDIKRHLYRKFGKTYIWKYIRLLKKIVNSPKLLMRRARDILRNNIEVSSE